MSDLISRQDAINTLESLSVLDRDGMETMCRTSVADADGWVGGLLAAIHAVEDMPSAEPERKTGTWVKVSGYFTPGGDPVWKCSECGKGMHVYGIEEPSYNRDYTDGHQWVACPNCGADMRGE